MCVFFACFWLDIHFCPIYGADKYPQTPRLNQTLTPRVLRLQEETYHHTRVPRHPQALTNSLKYIRHQQHGSSGHLKYHAFTVEPTSAHKPCKPYQTPTTWILWPYERPQPSTQSPQALSNLQNSSRHQHLWSLGNTRDHTLTAKPTSTHKHPQTL